MIVKPLTVLLQKDVEWKWGPEQEKAFQDVKTCLTTAPVLRFPDFTRMFIVATDASLYCVGAVLSQIQEVEGKNQEAAISYCSRHLTGAELRWSVIEKELFAIVNAVRTFYQYIFGQRFKLVTDHAPLQYLNSFKNPAGKIARWALELSEFDMDVEYRPGVRNANADFLIRIIGQHNPRN